MQSPFCPESHRRSAWQKEQRSRRRRNERSECCMEASAVRKLTGIDALSTPLNASLPMFSMIYALSPAVSHHGLKPCGSRMGPSAVRKLTGIDALSTPLNASLPMFSMIYALSPAVSHHGLKPCGSRMGPSAVRKLTGIGLQTHRLSNTGS